MDRRGFLARLGACAPSLSLGSKAILAATSGGGDLWAGQALEDITPPLGIEMAGFHKPPGEERRIEAIRQPPAARALYLRRGEVETAILSIDILAVSREGAARVQEEVERIAGIPRMNVRLCATHTHSMPTFRFLRQWGAIPVDYQKEVEGKLLRAVARAKEDAVPSELYVGRATARGANFNRTVKEWKTEDRFDEGASHADRWLDRLLQTLRLERSGGKGGLLWYHFSAHPVCYADEQAGPDWVGLVTETLRADMGIVPSFLQGHAGDVNPGDGEPWRGDAEATAARVCAAIREADSGSQKAAVDQIKTLSLEAGLPLNLSLFHAQVEQYRQDPSQCQSGEWVDAGFAEDWFQAALKLEKSRTQTPAILTALRLGEIGMLFHPSELYSYYGLQLRFGSPFPCTLAIGYTDDLIGYLTDPKAYENGEYAATTVPRILDLPPFAENAAEELVRQAGEMLQSLSV